MFTYIENILVLTQHGGNGSQENTLKKTRLADNIFERLLMSGNKSSEGCADFLLGSIPRDGSSSLRHSLDIGLCLLVEILESIDDRLCKELVSQ